MRYRHEYKYMIEARQEAILMVKAGGIISRDSHTREDGSYLIRSLYFDNLYDTCLWDNVSGANPRSKYRIRYYNDDHTYLCLEKKTKYNGMTLKEQCQLTEEEVKVFLKGMIPEIGENDSKIKKLFFMDIRSKGLLPKIIVTYERIPFTYPGGNVRITFDRKLSSSNEIERFLDGNYMERPIFPIGKSIMEVKWDEVMPRHIKEVMQLEDLTWTAFSKYYMCRMLHL